jgi:hypothetical protein
VALAGGVPGGTGRRDVPGSGMAVARGGVAGDAGRGGAASRGARLGRGDRGRTVVGGGGRGRT